ncbi:MAG: pilus assembly protein N-terminal domain-containing protein [Acidobacteriota bacterium]
MRSSGMVGAVVLAIAACVAAAAQSQPTRSERLVVGEQRTLRPGYPIGDIAVANPSVCDFRVVSGRREILLIANGEGFTTLTVWDQGGTKRDEVEIDVITREFQRLLTDLTDLLRPYPAVTVKRLGSRIVLSGTVNTQKDLDDLRTLAQAAGDILVMVTLPGADPAAPPAGDPTGGAVGDPGATRPVTRDPAAAGKVVVEPEPPPPARKPVPGAAQPVPLPPGPPPATPIVPGPPAAPLGQPGAARSIVYVIEVYESPASGPPPEVLGPQGTRVQMAAITTGEGREARQFLPVGAQSPAAGQPRGLSISLTPTVSGTTITTAVVIDTNLPIGSFDQRTPIWLRAKLQFSRVSGQTRYITEQELAGLVEPSVAMASAPGEPRAGGSLIPSPSSIVKGGGGQSPSPSTVLVIAITPSLQGPADGPRP